MRSLLLFLTFTAVAAAQPAAAGVDTVELPQPSQELKNAVAMPQPGETILEPKLRGVRFLTGPEQVAEPGFPADTIDVSRVPEFGTSEFLQFPALFMGQPVSRSVLNRLVKAVRGYAGATISPFVSVYLPPQEITGGYVQIVVSASKATGTVNVVGAKYFSENSYRAVLRQRKGEPIDAAQLNEDIAWLNRNPYRSARAVAGRGEMAGTTSLDLQVEERFPLGFSVGYDNTGTPATGADRMSFGVDWGNAFGRGDMLNLRVTADPELDHSRAYSGGYTTFLPWRHTLAVNGMWSRIDSVMPDPFSQVGHSWQVSARYLIPLRELRGGLAQNLTFTTDFKYSDNTLEFAQFPVTNNVTHVAQAGLVYALTWNGAAQSASLTTSLVGSPGGLSGRNHGRYFEGSRHGAKARYAYTRLDGSYTRRLPAGWSWNSSATVQLTNAALLGSEQLTGTGSGAVRGYRESSAFGDWGIVMNHELHAPQIGFARLQAALDLFGFIDLASLNLNVERESTDARSAGIGANLQVSRHFSLRFAYGWQLKKLDFHPDETGHGHIAASANW